MTRITTVPFRNEDEPLWKYIEDTTGAPVTGPAIRNLLYEHMNANIATKEINPAQGVIYNDSI